MCVVAPCGAFFLMKNYYKKHILKPNLGFTQQTHNERTIMVLNCLFKKGMKKL